MEDDVRRYGDYEVMEALGQGGMGVVYRARHVDTGEWVALKTVRVPSEDVVQTIRREIRALARARHSGIARIVAEGQHEGLPWYAMELLEGVTLRRRLAEWMPNSAKSTTTVSGKPRWWTDNLDPLTQAEREFAAEKRMLKTVPEVVRPQAAGGHLDAAIKLAMALCEPLAFLHGEGIVHCDLKPDNIMFRSPGEPVLVDFGLTARFWGQLSREVLDLNAMSTGTIAYMAPEQIRGELVDPRTDLYALGCILYLMVTGREPFSADSIPAMALKHLEQNPLPASRIADGVPRELDLLILDLLAKDPRKRIGYADDVAVRLAALLGPSRPSLDYRPYIYRPSFAGRSEVVESLEQHLTDVHHSQGSVMLLQGPSGSGKTRLVAEVAQRARNKGMQVFGGACSPRGTSGSGEAPLQAFRRLLQITADRCRSRGAQETRRMFGPHGHLLAAYEPSIGELDGIDDAEAVELDTEAARDRLFQSLAWTLGSLAIEKPMLVVLDDVQWADELSLKFLEHLLRSDALRTLPAVFLCTARTDEPGATIAHLEHAVRIELPRMNRDAIAGMVSDMLAIDPVPPALVQFLEERAHGTPFVITEMLRTAVEQGVLKRGETTGRTEASARWLLDDGTPLDRVDFHALPLPESLEGLLQRRLEALDEAGRQLTEAMAVLGPQAPTPLLLKVAGLSDEAASQALDQLLSSHVMERTRGGDEVRFVHEQLWQQAYDTMLAERRRGLHKRAAETLEGSPAFLQDSTEATIAEHWQRAGHHKRARAYYLRAAREAAEAYELETADGLYRQWLALAEATDTASIGVSLELAEILRIVGRWNESQALLEDALDRARTHDMKPLQADAAERLGALFNLRGQHQQALVHLRVARRMWARMGRLERLGVTLGEIGRVHRRRGDFDEASSHFERQMTVATTHDRTEQIVEAHMNMGRLSLHQGGTQEALQSFQNAFDMTVEHGLQQLRCIVLGDLGDAHLQTGEHEKAIRAYEDQLATAVLMGDRQSAASAVRQIGVAHWRHGHPEQALVCFTGSLKVALELGDLTAVAVTLARVADVETAAANYLRADRAYEIAIDLMRRAALRYYLSSALYRRAEVQLHLSEEPDINTDVDLIYELLTEAIEVSRAISRSRIELAAQTLLLILDVRTGDKPRDDAVRRLEEQLAACQHPLDQAALKWALWRVDPSDERRQAAADAYSDSSGRVSATARLRYLALTGEPLGTPELKALPPTLTKTGVSVTELIEHAADWF